MPDFDPTYAETIEPGTTALSGLNLNNTGTSDLLKAAMVFYNPKVRQQREVIAKDLENAPLPDLDEEARKLTGALGAWESRGQKEEDSYKAGNTNKLGTMGRWQFTPETFYEDYSKYYNNGQPIPETEKATLRQKFLSDPNFQQELAYRRTRDRLGKNLEKRGDLTTAIRDTIYDHYGHNGGNYDKPAYSKKLGRIVGESPNEYYRSVLGIMTQGGDYLNNFQPKTAPKETYKEYDKQKALDSYRAAFEEARKKSPDGIVVFGANGEFLDSEGRPLGVSVDIPSPEAPIAPEVTAQNSQYIAPPPPEPEPAAPPAGEVTNADVSSGETNLFSFDPSVQPKQEAAPETPSARVQSIMQKYAGVFAPNLLVDPNSPVSVETRKRKALDLTLHGDVPDLQTAEKLLEGKSASDLMGKSDELQQEDANKAQDSILTSIGKALEMAPGMSPVSLLLKAAGTKGVVGEVTKAGAHAAGIALNPFNILSSLAPKEYNAIQQATSPQTKAGKFIAEQGGGLAKMLEELWVAGAITQGQGGEAAKFSLATGLANVGPVLTGQKTGNEALQDMTTSAVIGGMIPPVASKAEAITNALGGGAVRQRLTRGALEGAGLAGVGATGEEVSSALKGETPTDEAMNAGAIGLGVFGLAGGLMAPHKAMSEGKYVTDAPLVEEAYVSKRPEYKGKTRKGIWIDDPDASIGAAIVGNRGLLHREGKSFIPEANIERPELTKEAEKVDNIVTKSEESVDNVPTLTDVKAKLPDIPVYYSDINGKPHIGVEADMLPKLENPKEAVKQLKEMGFEKKGGSYVYEYLPVNIPSDFAGKTVRGDYVKEGGKDAVTEGVVEPSEAVELPGDNVELQPKRNNRQRKAKVEEARDQDSAGGGLQPSEEVRSEEVANEPIVETPTVPAVATAEPTPVSVGAERGAPVDIMATPEAKEVISKLPVNTASSAKDIKDYAIRNRVPFETGESWGNILKKVQVDAVEKAVAKGEIIRPTEVQNAIETGNDVARGETIPQGAADIAAVGTDQPGGENVHIRSGESPTGGEGDIVQSGTGSRAGALRAEVFPGVERVAREVGSVLKEDVWKSTEKFYEGLKDATSRSFEMASPGTKGRGAALGLRGAMGRMRHNFDMADHASTEIRKGFDKMNADENLDFIRRYEAGEPLNDFEQKAAYVIENLNTAAQQLLQKAYPGRLKNARKNYFPHYLFVNEGDASTYSSLKERRTPLEGKRSFFRNRKYNDIADVMFAAKEHNLKLISDNPMELALAHYGLAQRAAQFKAAVNEFKRSGYAVFVRQGKKVPEGYKLIDDPAFKTTQMVENPHVKGSRLPVQIGGWAIPENGARVVNNYLKPGLGSKKWYTSLRGVTNMMNSVQLSMSAFHAQFTAINTFAVQMALAFKQLKRGEFGRAAKSLASIPAAPVSYYVNGKKFRAAYLDPLKDPALAPAVKAYEAAGGNINPDHAQLTHIRDRMKDFWREGKYGRAILRSPLALMEYSMVPLMEKYIPTVKVGVFNQHIADYLRSHPEATPNEINNYAAKAMDAMDNVFGLVNYENIFFDKRLKDLLMISVRSVGWNHGTLRQFGGAAKDAVEIAKKGGKGDLSDRITYSLALPMVTAGIGAITQAAWTTLNTGTPQPPSTNTTADFMLDVYFPRTGKTDEHGNPERIGVASFMKDLWHVFGSLSRAEAPVDMVINKLNPVWGTVGDIARNADFYGTEVINEDDPIYQQGLQLLGYVGKQFMPFTFRNVEKSVKLEGKVKPEAFAQLFGFTPAPRDIVKSSFVRALDEYSAEKMKVGGANTHEQMERRFEKHAIRRQWQLGDKEGAVARAKKDLQEGTIAENDIKAIESDISQTTIERKVKHLSVAELLKAYPKATEDEAAQVFPMILQKIENADLSKMLPEEKERLVNQVKEFQWKSEFKRIEESMKKYYKPDVINNVRELIGN